MGAAPVKSSPAYAAWANQIQSHTLLAKGSQGQEVRFLQAKLARELQQSSNPATRELGNKLVRNGLSGKFDADTEKAVEAYQRMNDLQADGKVGDQTWSSLLSRGEVKLAPGQAEMGRTQRIQGGHEHKTDFWDPGTPPGPVDLGGDNRSPFRTRGD